MRVVERFTPTLNVLRTRCGKNLGEAAHRGLIVGICTAAGAVFFPQNRVARADDFHGSFHSIEERNDRFFNDNGKINTRTNNSGGIQGGISNGQDIYFRVAFKSVATILMEQDTVNMESEETVLKAKGRHDPCVLPRAVPIVEAMTAMTLLDFLLIQKTRS